MLKEDLAEKIATFRFGVIADFVIPGSLPYGERERLYRQKTARSYEIPGSNRTRISRPTIVGWIAAYKAKGLEGLRPKRRSDYRTYRKIDATLRTTIAEIKRENPYITLPNVIHTLRHRHILGANEKLNSATIYRFMRQEKLSDPQTAAQADRRRYEASFPNQIWQCDVMHGPLVREAEGSPKKKSYLFAIMDDHSRLIIHASFCLNETFESLKHCLYQAIAKRGLPQKFYVDNGSCYRASNLEQILAGLGVGLTHSRPFLPQGRGKIERWFRNVRESFLALHAEDGILMTTLNERLATWIEEYHAKEHSVIKTTPENRFKANLSCIRPAPKDLLSHFRFSEQRKVKRDRTFQLNSKIFEAPIALIDRTIELRFHPEEPDQVEIFYEGLSYGTATLLDAHINSRLGRDFGEPRDRSIAHPMTSPESPTIKSGQLFGSYSPDDRGDL
jgi:putative transposase